MNERKSERELSGATFKPEMSAKSKKMIRQGGLSFEERQQMYGQKKQNKVR